MLSVDSIRSEAFYSAANDPMSVLPRSTDRKTNTAESIDDSESLKYFDRQYNHFLERSRPNRWLIPSNFFIMEGEEEDYEDGREKVA